MISRSQRITSRTLCSRHQGADGTSICVWCSHTGLAPAPGNHVRIRYRLLTASGPGKRGKRENPLVGSVRLLTQGGLIRVRLARPMPRRGTVVVRPARRSTILCRSPTPGYWITSVAWKRNVGGSVRPMAWAVFRLMTNSNCIGCSTGRSAGVAPLRILSTYVAACRNRLARSGP